LGDARFGLRLAGMWLFRAPGERTAAGLQQKIGKNMDWWLGTGVWQKIGFRCFSGKILFGGGDCRPSQDSRWALESATSNKPGVSSFTRTQRGTAK
jgi:hypothetical protein